MVASHANAYVVRTLTQLATALAAIEVLVKKAALALRTEAGRLVYPQSVGIGTLLLRRPVAVDSLAGVIGAHPGFAHALVALHVLDESLEHQHATALPDALRVQRQHEDSGSEPSLEKLELRRSDVVGRARSFADIARSEGVTKRYVGHLVARAE